MDLFQFPDFLTGVRSGPRLCDSGRDVCLLQRIHATCLWSALAWREVKRKQLCSSCSFPGQPLPTCWKSQSEISGIWRAPGWQSLFKAEADMCIIKNEQLSITGGEHLSYLWAGLGAKVGRVTAVALTFVQRPFQPYTWAIAQRRSWFNPQRYLQVGLAKNVA